jgi:hypothetical protein
MFEIFKITEGGGGRRGGLGGAAIGYVKCEMRLDM